MNFGKLLGSGKSFFGGNSNVAYRENKRVYLPKFNAEKNPFAPKPEKTAEPAPAAVAPEVKKISAPKISAPLAAKTQIFTSVPAPKPVRAANWTAKLNPFRAPAPTRLAQLETMQEEFSLDAVKVVHNDLADADIEIVPVKSRTLASPDAPILTPSRSAWEFLGERLVKQI